jgi:hypothetical protein
MIANGGNHWLAILYENVFGMLSHVVQQQWIERKQCVD